MTKIPTSERLAQILHAEGLFDMEKKAREGYYDDYKSPLETPIVQLVRDLQTLADNFQGRGVNAERTSERLRKLARRAMDGDFDGTKEEGDAWWQKEGGEVLQKLKRQQERD